MLAYAVVTVLWLIIAGLALIGAIFVLYVTTRPPPEPVSWACPSEWVVMPGDTLWGIAERCWPEAHTGQMVAAIREANPGVDPGRLRVGQVLRLPVATEIAGDGR